MARAQKPRLLFLAIYAALLFGASWLAFGSVLPPSGPESLWFYSGLAALLLGNLIVTPFYVKPADALSYSVAAIIALATTLPAQGATTRQGQILWIMAIGYNVFVLVASIVAMVLRNEREAKHGFGSKLSKVAYVMSDRLGNPRVLFSVVYAYSLVAFHSDDPRELLVLGATWAVIVAFRPLEAIADALRAMGVALGRRGGVSMVGDVVGLQTPGLVLVRLRDGVVLAKHSLLLVSASGAGCRLAVSLDLIGYAEGTWLRIALLDCPEECQERIDQFAVDNKMAADSVFEAPVDLIDRDSIDDPLWCRRDSLVGLIAADSDVSQIRVELIDADYEYEQGMLLEAAIGKRPALYQVMNGLTREELLQFKNTRGFVRADAERVGHWDVQTARFDPVTWLPSPNAGVFVALAPTLVVPSTAIGRFPGTNYSVSIDVQKLVTHSAAILGILGIGKSYLGMELVERMIDQGIKVVLIDLTNQYGEMLDHMWPKAYDEASDADLMSACVGGKTHVSKNVEEGGSVPAFTDAMRQDIQAFLDPNQTSRQLRIINPSHYEVWVQESKPFGDTASMATMTPPQITRIISEAVLLTLQHQGMTDSAQCCIVMEEAHALTPEWNSVASDRDREATNGTGRAILQGRKYGMGCLLITQRTANVTKTILNQCNTIFAMRSYDATGIDFLSNYVGKQFASVVSTLGERHAIVFGRASSCTDPVLVRLNDRDNFVEMRKADLAAQNLNAAPSPTHATACTETFESSVGLDDVGACEQVEAEVGAGPMPEQDSCSEASGPTKWVF